MMSFFYFLSVLPGGQPSAAALEDFGQQSGTQLTWKVDIAAGVQNVLNSDTSLRIC